MRGRLTRALDTPAWPLSPPVLNRNDTDYTIVLQNGYVHVFDTGTSCLAEGRIELMVHKLGPGLSRDFFQALYASRLCSQQFLEAIRNSWGNERSFAVGGHASPWSD